MVMGLVADVGWHAVLCVFSRRARCPPTACALAQRRSIDVTTSKRADDASTAVFADAYAASGLCRQNQQAADVLLAAAEADAKPAGGKHGGVPQARAASAAARLRKLGGSQGTATPWCGAWPCCCGTAQVGMWARTAGASLEAAQLACHAMQPLPVSRYPAPQPATTRGPAGCCRARCRPSSPSSCWPPCSGATATA